MPCPPPLTVLLHDHLVKFGTAGDGRLFRNLTGGDLAESWLAAGVPSTQCAEWAGHSVAVLH